MKISADQAFDLTRYLIAAALFLQSIEILRLDPLLSDRGPWNWSRMRQDIQGLPLKLRGFLDFVFAEDNFAVLILVQLITALVVFWVRSPVFLSFAFFSALLISVRFRGAFNGGSDAMTLVLLMGLSVSAWFRPNASLFEAGIIYIGLHSILSYLSSALVKLKQGAWRNGQALQAYVRHSSYEVPIFVKRIFRSGFFSAMAAWALMLFEVSLLLIPYFPTYAYFWFPAAVLFHLMNFAVLGLNRFVWVWIASYPSLMYVLLLFR